MSLWAAASLARASSSFRNEIAFLFLLEHWPLIADLIFMFHVCPHNCLKALFDIKYTAIDVHKPTVFDIRGPNWWEIDPRIISEFPPQQLTTSSRNLATIWIARPRSKQKQNSFFLDNFPKPVLWSQWVIARKIQSWRKENNFCIKIGGANRLLLRAGLGAWWAVEQIEPGSSTHTAR